MTPNHYGELIFSSSDICDAVMSGTDITALTALIVDDTVDLEQLKQLLNNQSIHTWKHDVKLDLSVQEYDQQLQQNWFMPQEYRQLDIAEYVLNLCSTPEQLQRVGAELLLYQDRNLFDLLRYLKYLVDVMKQHNIIWGVGRGSSVASYVLFLLKVHKIDSMFYDLDPREFLR
jgi:DNA polymerase III alpha subunit